MAFEQPILRRRPGTALHHTVSENPYSATHQPIFSRREARSIRRRAACIRPFLVHLLRRLPISLRYLFLLTIKAAALRALDSLNLATRSPHAKPSQATIESPQWMPCSSTPSLLAPVSSRQEPSASGSPILLSLAQDKRAGWRAWRQDYHTAEMFSFKSARPATMERGLTITQWCWSTRFRFMLTGVWVQ